MRFTSERQDHLMPEDRYSVFDPGFRVARERRPDAGPVAGKTLPASAPARAGTSLALGHLRGIVIVVVVAFHSALAYLAWLSRPPRRSTSRPSNGARSRSSTVIAGSASTCSAPGRTFI